MSKVQLHLNDTDFPFLAKYKNLLFPVPFFASALFFAVIGFICLFVSAPIWLTGIAAVTAILSAITAFIVMTVQEKQLKHYHNFAPQTGDEIRSVPELYAAWKKAKNEIVDTSTPTQAVVFDETYYAKLPKNVRENLATTVKTLNKTLKEPGLTIEDKYFAESSLNSHLPEVLDLYKKLASKNRESGSSETQTLMKNITKIKSQAETILNKVNEEKVKNFTSYNSFLEDNLK